MNDTIKKDPMMIRKSAFGRTNLFLKSTSVLLREIKSSTSTFTRNASCSVFHTHSTCSAEQTKSVCWHCCHGVENQEKCLRVPRLYDNVERLYHVYGWFCTPSCAKAYILEHSSFDRGYQMNVFLRMLREVYGITEPITEAPPRLALRMFGGPFDIESFRSQTNICAMLEPPFVSYCMLVEERLPMPEIGEKAPGSELSRGSVRGLRRPEGGSKILMSDDISTPPNESMYQNFMQTQTTNDNMQISDTEPAQPSTSTGAIQSSKRQKKEITKKPVSESGLARFRK